jgi:hypothetical protein
MPVDENDGQNPAESPRYFGDEACCALCGRVLTVGELVNHDTGKDKLICYADPDQAVIQSRDCYKEWSESHKCPSDAVVVKMFMGCGQAEVVPRTPAYSGAKIKCDQCGKAFVLGSRIIKVDSEVEGFEPLIFCLSAVGHSVCMIQWVVKHGKRLNGTEVEFWGYQA